MDKDYFTMATILSGHCGAHFTDAKIRAHLSEGFSDIEYICNKHGQTTAFLPSIMESSSIDDALHDLRKSMTIPGEQPWSRCTFTLFPDGKFKFDVEYDD